MRIDAIELRVVRLPLLRPFATAHGMVIEPSVLLARVVAECAERRDDLSEHHLALIEQPLGTDDLTGHAALAERLQTPVCLAESLSSLGILDAALALGAVDVACIKPSRLGGLAIAKQAQE